MKDLCEFVNALSVFRLVRAWITMGAHHETPNPFNLEVEFAPLEHRVNVLGKIHCQNELSSTEDSVFTASMTNKFTPLGFDTHDATMLQDAYDAITKADMWEYMRLPSTPGKDGFMFSNAIELAAISTEMTYDGHSGSSYAWTMRQMEAIAKKGWETYTNEVRAHRALEQLRAEEADARRRSERAHAMPTYGSACPCRSATGYTSGWCGVAGGGVPACDH
jgi:hypothetical protein